MKSLRFITRFPSIPPTFIVIAVLLVGIRLVVAYTRYWDTDELQHLHAAWCVAQGQLLYRDFFEHHGPLLPLLMAPLVALFRSPESALFAVRIASAAAWVAILFATAQLVQASFSRRWAWASVFFLVVFSTFAIKTVEFRPDVPAAAAMIWSLVFLKPDNRKTFVSGLLAGLSFLFTPKGVYVLGGALAAFCWAHRKDKRRMILLAAGLLGILLPIGITLGYFWIKGGLPALIECFWTFNVRFRGTFSAWPFLIQSIRENPSLWLLCAVGFLVPGTPWIWRGALIGWWIGLWRLPLAYQQFYLFCAPVLAAIASSGLCFLWGRCKNQNSRIGMGTLVLAGLVPSLVAQTKDFAETNRPQAEEIRCLMERTSPQDKVFDAWTGVPVFRQHAWYFWFLHDEVRVMLRPDFLEQGCLRALADPACRAFIWGETFSTLPEKVKAFARQHYRPAGCGRLFVRKNP
jgi:hypothetical protein